MRPMTLVLALCLLLPAGCSDADEEAVIVVGSLATAESENLAHLYAALLDADVEPRTGDRAAAMAAVVDGEIDLYPDYSGAGLDFLAGQDRASPEVDTTAGAFRRLAQAEGLRVYDPSGASAQLAVVVTFATAEGNRIYDVSGLARLDRSPTLAVPPGCDDDSACLPLLASSYDIVPSDTVEADDGYEALAALDAGTVDAAVLPATDGALGGTDHVMLVDDAGTQPAENVIPVVTRRLRADDERRDRIYNLLDRLAEELTTADVRELNRRVTNGAPPDEVASDILEDKGLFVR